MRPYERVSFIHTLRRMATCRPAFHALVHLYRWASGRFFATLDTRSRRQRVITLLLLPAFAVLLQRIVACAAALLSIFACWWCTSGNLNSQLHVFKNSGALWCTANEYSRSVPVCFNVDPLCIPQDIKQDVVQSKGQSLCLECPDFQAGPDYSTKAKMFGLATRKLSSGAQNFRALQ
jgi:hypothetical protein